MAEAFNELTLPAAKAERYAALAEEIAAVLEGESNLTARMATVASMLAASFETFFWTGFYVVDPDKERELVVGPYQGSTRPRGPSRRSGGQQPSAAATRIRRNSRV